MEGHERMYVLISIGFPQDSITRSKWKAELLWHPGVSSFRFPEEILLYEHFGEIIEDIW